MALKKGVDVKPANGKLGILLPGHGRGRDHVHRRRRWRSAEGSAKPIGSLTQMGTIRLGKRTDNRSPADQGLRAARRSSTTSCSAAGTSSPTTPTRPRARPACSTKRAPRASSRPSSTAIKPMTAVFEQAYVKKLNGAQRQEGHVEDGPRRAADGRHQALQGRRTAAIASSRCGAARPRSTASRRDVHASLDDVRGGPARRSHDDIAPSQIYAYACLKMRRARTPTARRT